LGPLAGTLSVTRGHLRIFDGDWREALRCCEIGEAALRAEAITPTWERNIGRMGMLRALEELGLLEQARARSREWLNDAQDRGDTYAEVTFALYLGMAELIAGDARNARVLHERVFARCQPCGFTVQHMYAARLDAVIQLFERAPLAAWNGVKTIWPQIRRARLLSLPITRLDAVLLRGRVAVAAAEAGRKEALSVAAGAVQSLAGEARSDAIAGGRALGAALAWGAGARRQADRLLEEASRLYESAGMETMRLFVDRRRAQITGRTGGASAPEALGAALQGRGIGNPLRMAAVLTPGFDVEGWNAGRNAR
jgi:hypothetical protein